MLRPAPARSDLSARANDSQVLHGDLIVSVVACPSKASQHRGSKHCLLSGSRYPSPHMGVYENRGTLLGSLLKRNPTIWGPMLKVPSCRTPPCWPRAQMKCHQPLSTAQGKASVRRCMLALRAEALVLGKGTIPHPRLSGWISGFVLLAIT